MSKLFLVCAVQSDLVCSSTSSDAGLDCMHVATLVLGSRPRQKGLQGCGPKGSLGVTSETPGSARECEGVSLHTPKATPTLGEGVPVDSRNFREPFEGSKLNGLWRSLYHWKALRT
jgi:hypothetical protein